MNLAMARFITNKTQLDIQANTGVFQTKLSRFENYKIDCLRLDEKRKIENYLGLKIDWNLQQKDDPLNRLEKSEIKFFLNYIKKAKGEKETMTWLNSFESDRELYEGIAEFLNLAITWYEKERKKL